MFKVTIYIPENHSDGRPRPHVFERAKEDACEIAGGASTTYADGAWIPIGSKKILAEPVRVLTVIVGSVPQRAALRKLARRVKAELGQETVLFTSEAITAEFI